MSSNEGAAEPPHRPAITAVVATRGRGPLVVQTVESILANDHPDFAVLVIDQSDDDSTETAVAPFRTDPRFSYMRSDTVGQGRAQNIATRTVGSPYVAFTDDDCDVPRGWLSCLAETLDRHEDVGVVYSNVAAGPHDAAAGFVPDYTNAQDRVVSTVIGKVRARGIGASMAVRREVFQSIGGFDENMGPGAAVPSAGDRDLAIRAVLAGHSVFETARTTVVHHGFRTWEEGKVLTGRDWIGLGGMCAKPLRAGHLSTIVYPIYELSVNGVLLPLARVLQGARPRGFRRVGYFIRGFVRGWRLPLDRDHLVFRDRDDA